jgi:hypothetical protein
VSRREEEKVFTMLDQIILWGADRVCNIVDLTGLESVIGHPGNSRCPYQGSRNAGIIFWAVTGIVLLLVRIHGKKKH